MTGDSVCASAVMGASAERIFAVLADPTQHASIDGTGWVVDSLNDRPLTHAGQVFRVAMYHPNHPNGNYEIANRVEEFEPPRVIAWKPGYDGEDGELHFGGWIWRYDLASAGPAQTEVTLTYDWSAVSEDTREHIGFPPFPPDHLRNSLAHLAELARSGR